MIKATTLDEVIIHVDNIIEWCKQHQSRMGYFAVLYRRMTVAVKEGIVRNEFEDGKRMEMLDTIFANLYLQAWEAYINKQKCSNAWFATFNACGNENLIVLQQLILGINTHINLDLGIAAAEACPGNDIYSLQKDFEKINDVIATLNSAVQNTLCNIWFPLRLLVKIADGNQDAVLNFSIGAARKASWANAVALAIAEGPVRSNYINMMDNTVAKIADRVIHPGLGINLLLRPVRRMEDKSVVNIIKLLNV